MEIIRISAYVHYRNTYTRELQTTDHLPFWWICFLQIKVLIKLACHSTGVNLGGGCRGCAPPLSRDEAFFVFTFKTCFPHQSVTSFLRGAPPPKKNPGSTPVLLSFSQEKFSKDNFNTRWVLFCILLSYRESNKFGSKNTASSFNKLPFSNNSHTSCTTLCTM